MSGVNYQIPLGTLLLSLEFDHPQCVYYLLEYQYQIQLPSHRWWGSLAEGLIKIIDVDAYTAGIAFLRDVVYIHCTLKF